MTAGICEEWLFRGFLLNYLAVRPWHLPFTVAFVLVAVAFGAGHFYQGAKGILSTGLIGALFGFVYLVSGTLLVPMVAHALVDVRALALIMAAQPRPGDEAAAIAV